MIRIALVGDIGSGKSYIAKNFGFPVFDADYEVSKLYKTDKKVFVKIKKALPEYFYSFPLSKTEITNAILAEKKNLKKIVKIVHLEIRKKMNFFLKKNKDKKIVILDIPLYLENKLNKKKDIIIFVQSKKTDIEKKLKRRKNFNKNIYKKFKEIQLSLDNKKKKSQFIIKNDFTKKTVKKSLSKILNIIL